MCNKARPLTAVELCNWSTEKKCETQNIRPAVTNAHK